MSMENNKIDEKALDQVNGGVIVQRSDKTYEVREDDGGALRASGMGCESSAQSLAAFFRQSGEVLTEEQFNKRYQGVTLEPKQKK